MSDVQNIAVVCDEEIVRHDIVTVLNFVGENVQEFSFKQWLSELTDVDKKEFSAAFLCAQGQHKLVSDFLKNTAQAHIDMAVVNIGNEPELAEGLDERTKAMLVASFEKMPGYCGLNDALHRAQAFVHALHARRAQHQRRPIHLFSSLVGNSQSIEQVRDMMTQVTDKDVTVLIEGESGTGKEVVARNLHYHSDRRDGPFVPVNCGAIPAELLESELFGHEKGAFTGAISARAGRFELAEGGTLFLDEIGDMPLHMQVKILRVLQEKSFERVGGNKSYKTNVRIIAATHRNLEDMIAKGDFREDLYYRLNVFPIEMPSLRERSEDVPLLINELIKRLESEKRGSVRFSSSAMLSLCQHPWPGNVRELANLVERMAIMRPGAVIGVAELPEKYRHVDIENDFDDFTQDDLAGASPSLVSMGDTVLLPEAGIDLKEYMSDLEQNLIQQALDNNSGVVARAAEQLAIRRTTLVEKMRKYGMQR
ncbi:sigma-54 dependent transcriptional regulator [Agaribacterium sp. ZY112]|uniref:sigma-54 dependent transcriptional regulator n=1 Tax=Agaribacterium sp. ZY112 TaxID=3233574 RepID=UPI00352425B5